MAELTGLQKHYLTFLLLSAVLVVAVILRRRTLSDPLRSLPGPRGNCFIGIGISLPPRAHNVMRDWAAQYGELFRIRVGWYDWVVVNSPEAMKDIFDKQVRRRSGHRRDLTHFGAVCGDVFESACADRTRGFDRRHEDVHNVSPPSFSTHSRESLTCRSATGHTDRNGDCIARSPISFSRQR